MIIPSINYSEPLKNLLTIERAISDLRRGCFVLHQQYNRFILITAIENLTEEILQIMMKLGSAGNYLTITANRADYVFPTRTERGSVNIPLATFTLTELKNIAMGNQQYFTHDYSMQTTTELDLMTIELLKYGQILPAALVVDLTEQLGDLGTATKFAEQNQIILLDSQLVTTCKSNLDISLQIVARSPLHLSYAAQAEIVAFRSSFSTKEHYAIILGEANPQQIPVIRVHSNCYTGDLLSSLSCDCHDQLHYALRYMGELKDNYGILIYLMQEGRDIGLVNKIRSYLFQHDDDVDTVDANLMLGFNDDERSFLSAAEILRLLDVNNVRLLSNNPQKSADLIKYGVVVEEVIALQTVPQQYNMEYLKTKTNRFGHKLS